MILTTGQMIFAEWVALIVVLFALGEANIWRKKRKQARK